MREKLGRSVMVFVIFLCATIFFLNPAESALRIGSIGGLDLPVRVAVDSKGDIYVTDSLLNQMKVFRRDGSEKHVLSGLNGPLGVAVDSAGRIYIGNENKSGVRGSLPKGSVDVYSAEYRYLFSFGKGQGEFRKPNAIAVHSSGSIYVTDSNAHVVKIYNPNGSLQGSFGVWGSLDGSKDGEFSFPAGLAIDEINSEIYVTDSAIFVDPVNGPTLGARIQVFDLAGGFIRSFGRYGSGDGFLIRPLGIAYDEDRLYITDAFQNVVQVFDSVGNHIETMYDLAHEMATPIGIAVGGDNRIFIASSGTKTVEIYGKDNYTYLTVTPDKLSFLVQAGKRSVTQNISIGNDGLGELAWTMTADPAWITLGSASGIIGASGSAAVAIGIDAASLATGAYKGSITVIAGGAEKKIDVTVEVIQPPLLTVTPSAVSFRAQAGGDVPAGQSVNISITDDMTGTAEWTATSDAAWLSMSPASGTSAALTTASVSVRTALGAGMYTGTIIVVSEGAIGSPANVAVTLELIAAGNIAVTTNIAEANFSITGPASYSGSGEDWSMTDAPAGQYSITFNKVIGFKTPASQTFTVETGKTSSISGTYKDLRASKKVIAGMGEGMANVAGVKVLNTDGTSAGSAFTAFAYKYGANVAAGDIDGDGIDEIIAGAGSAIWHPARVTVFRADGTAIPGLGFVAFQSNNGVNVAAGDVDGDGAAEIIVGTEPGKGISANVRVFKVVEGRIQDTGINFITDPARSGVYIAAGDLDGDGIAEIITGTTLSGSFGADNLVRTWSADTSKGLGSWAVKSVNTFKPYGRDRGAVVAAGDINGDGTDEILVAEAVSKNAKIRAYKGDGTFAGLEIIERNLQGPLSMASGDTDSDGQAEIVIGAGPVWLNPAAVRVYSGTGTFLQGFTAFSERGGVNVGLGKVE